MQILTKRALNALRIRLLLERYLDGTQKAAFKKEWDTATADPAITCVILDCAGVTHFSSAYLELLIILDKALKQRQGTLSLMNVEHQVGEVLEITKLHKCFPVFLRD